MTSKFGKSVHLAFGGDAFKTVYYDWERAALRPNLVFIDKDGVILFEINEFGLKGDAIDDSRKLAVVWGDSVVFGHGRSWPCLLDNLAPGYQFLNGGIEGDRYDNILRRALTFNRERHVAWNVLMPGWHPTCTTLPVPDMTEFRERLLHFLREAPNSVLLTMPTALNVDIVDNDLSSAFRDGEGDTRFLPGFWPYTIGTQQAHFYFIVARNKVVRDLCVQTNTRLIDLFKQFDTRNDADFRIHYEDMIHLRASAYPHVAKTVYDGLADLL